MHYFGWPYSLNALIFRNTIFNTIIVHQNALITGKKVTKVFIYFRRWAFFAHFLGSKMNDSWSKIAEPPSFLAIASDDSLLWSISDISSFIFPSWPGLSKRAKISGSLSSKKLLFWSICQSCCESRTILSNFSILDDIRNFSLVILPIVSMTTISP